MPLSQSDTDPFAQYAEITPTSPPAESTTGSGGADLDMWGMTMEQRYELLAYVPTEYITDHSQYDLFPDPAVLSSPGDPFEAFEDRALSESVSTGAQTGIGGADLDMWDRSMDHRYELLGFVDSQSIENYSQFSLFDEPGVLNSPGDSYAADGTKAVLDPNQVTAGYGITAGINVFAFNIFGRVWAVPDPNDPDLTNALRVGNAQITVIGPDLQSEATSASDGVFTAYPPSAESTLMIQADHAILGTTRTTIDIGTTDTEVDLFYPIPTGGSGGFAVGRGFL